MSVDSWTSDVCVSCFCVFEGATQQRLSSLVLGVSVVLNDASCLYAGGTVSACSIE